MTLLRDRRVLVVEAVALLVAAAASRKLAVTMPQITLAPEELFRVGPVPVTNSMLALMVSELLLVGLAFWTGRHLQLVPGGLQNLFEAIVEFWQNQSEQLIGQQLTRSWLPLVLSVFLVIWFANYFHLVPVFDDLGILCAPGHCPGQETAIVASVPGTEGVKLETFDVRWTGGAAGKGVGLIQGPHQASTPAGQSAASEAGTGEGYAFVPLLRAPAADLNFTVALALIAFIVVEIIGFRTWGPRYVTKFVNLDFHGGIGNGLLHFFVGFIELTSELARIVSFAFRLFGNIFAGSVMLIVVPFLIPFLVVVPVYGLELLMGLIQAYVFAILILAFITLALAPLHEEEP